MERKKYGKYSTAHSSSPRDVPEQIQKEEIITYSQQRPTLGMVLQERLPQSKPTPGDLLRLMFVLNSCS